MLKDEPENQDAWDALVSAIKVKPLLVFGRLLAHHISQLPESSSPESLIAGRVAELKSRTIKISDYILALDVIDARGNSFLTKKSNYLERFPEIRNASCVRNGGERLYFQAENAKDGKPRHENYLFTPYVSTHNARSGFIVLTFDGSLEEGVERDFRRRKGKESLIDMVSFLSREITADLYKSDGLLAARLLEDVFDVKKELPDDTLEGYCRIFLGEGNIYHVVIAKFESGKKTFFERPQGFERREDILKDDELNLARVFGRRQTDLSDFSFYDFAVPLCQNSEWKGVVRFGVKIPEKLPEMI